MSGERRLSFAGPGSSSRLETREAADSRSEAKSECKSDAESSAKSCAKSCAESDAESDVKSDAKSDCDARRARVCGGRRLSLVERQKRGSGERARESERERDAPLRSRARRSLSKGQEAVVCRKRCVWKKARHTFVKKTPVDPLDALESAREGVQNRTSRARAPRGDGRVSLKTPRGTVDASSRLVLFRDRTLSPRSVPKMYPIRRLGQASDGPRSSEARSSSRHLAASWKKTTSIQRSRSSEALRFQDRLLGPNRTAARV